MAADLPPPNDELAALTRAFAQHLRTLEARGLRQIAAAPSPRFGVEIPRGATVEPREPVEPRGPDPTEPREVPAASAAAADDVDDVAEPAAPATRPLDDLIDDGSRPPLERLGALRDHIGDCQRCRLANKRRNIVFGVGNPDADLMFIGEAPGFDEDQQGIPFVGKAGQLLTRMIKAMGLSREEVYIANIVKCRPPQNRDPEPDEIASCEPFLKKQIDIIAPRIIIALGSFAVKTLLRTKSGIMRLRGKWKSYHGIPLMPTFHPAYLLRNEAGKRPVWMDLQQVMAEMDRLGLQRRR